jgi:tungstate transport system ATP-binding protein
MDLDFDGVRVVRGGRLVLEIPSLRIRGGRTTAILGPNGSGKTTLLRLIAGLERPHAGRVNRSARLQSDQSSDRLVPDRSGHSIAYVFQEQVFLRRSVRENLELGLRLRGIEKEQRRHRIEEAAGRLGVAHLLDRRADQLSGGEGRRVSLARALCLQASLVLLDEPLEGLDERTYVRLLDELPPLLAAFAATTLLVTHNRDEALRLAEDLVVLVEGRVHAAGDKRDVVTNPRVTEVAEVLGHTVLGVNGRRLAVPPGGLLLGPGRTEFSMIVDSVLDLVDHREIAGRVGDAIVRVRLPAASDSPKHGERVLIHANQASEVR